MVDVAGEAGSENDSRRRGPRNDRPGERRGPRGNGDRGDRRGGGANAGGADGAVKRVVRTPAA